MSRYSVKIKQSPGWDQNPVGMISISQGQVNHEGDKLDALLAWGLANHKQCYLNISDTLHRHNLLRHGHDEQEAAQTAFRLGNEWMQRNAAILEKYLPRFAHVHRWNDWLYHAEFEDTHKAVWAQFENDPAFREAALTDIAFFVARKQAQGEDTTDQEKFDSSQKYLLEETAIYIIMARTYAANRVYPAKPLATFEYLRHTPDLPPLLRGMERAMCVRVLLKRMADLPPQAAPRLSFG